MANRFTDWLTEYDKLTQEVMTIPLVDIKETLSVGGESFTLSMGKESKVTLGDNDVQPRMMRSYYTNNKKEFEGVLDILRTRVREQRVLAINVINALTESAVPEVVMARLQGEKVSGDAFDMLRLATTKKVEELVKIVFVLHTTFESFAITIPCAGRFLHFDNSGGLSELYWLKRAPKDHRIGARFKPQSSDYISAGTILRYEQADLDDDMFFLSNFDFIAKDLRELKSRIENF